MVDDRTIRFYAENAPRYTLDFGQAPSRHLDAFLDLLEFGARILELGCGGGRDAARMIERGFEVDATDGTPAMVRKANERFDIRARVMGFDQLNATREYDAIWAHACLLHIPRAGLPDTLSAIRGALRPEGLHFANYKLADAAHPNEGRDKLGRWTNLPDAPDLLDLYRDTGFNIVKHETYLGKGADGTQRDWLAVTVQRPD